MPRSVWHGKPVDSGVRVGEWMGMRNTNLSSPLWAELWLDFGPFGMLLGFLLVGYACDRADRAYVRRTLDDGRPGNVLAVVVPLVAGYCFILLRGPLLQAAGRIGIARGVPGAGDDLQRDRPEGSSADARLGGPGRCRGGPGPPYVAIRSHPAAAFRAEPRHRPHAAPSTPPHR